MRVEELELGRGLLAIAPSRGEHPGQSAVKVLLLHEGGATGRLHATAEEELVVTLHKAVEVASPLECLRSVLLGRTTLALISHEQSRLHSRLGNSPG